MTRVLIFAVALGFAIAPIPAVAGIDVDPSDLRPELFIRAEKESPSSESGVTTSAPTGGKVDEPEFRPPILCPVDAETGLYGCRNVDPDEAEPDEAELTEGDILRAVREIGLPSLEVQIQPGDQTLVNIPTIFFTRPQPFERSIDLLGFDIDLVAEPVRYRWVHGDGTARSTGRAGRPYPAMDVTHRYRTPAEDIDPRVDVTYRVRYRVDGGGWQTVGQTLVASGPPADLDVREAAPVLRTP